jgi:hypothetical protein
VGVSSAPGLPEQSKLADHTGPIEGACRHLTATAWRSPDQGGESTAPKPSSTPRGEDNQDLDTCFAYHLAPEHHRLYPIPDQHNYHLMA